MREAAGLTQEELADLAGVHRTYVSLVERGERVPTVTVFIRLCHASGSKASTIIERIEARL